jgi:predicted DNA binding CopG/RHH family protein
MATRTVTIRIDDELVDALKERARKETINAGVKVTFNRICSQVLSKHEKVK